MTHYPPTLCVHVSVILEKHQSNHVERSLAVTALPQTSPPSFLHKTGRQERKRLTMKALLLLVHVCSLRSTVRAVHELSSPFNITVYLYFFLSLLLVESRHVRVM